VSFQYPAPNDSGTTSYVFTRTLRGADGADPETTRAQFEEFFQLYREGKATEIAPGMWRATLANGKEFTFTGNPETDRGAAFTEEEKARLQQVTEEINELRQAGKGERTFWKETENNGMRIRLYNVRYTLSNGEVITLCEGEEAPRQ
jgi:hypothetical protein